MKDHAARPYLGRPPGTRTVCAIQGCDLPVRWDPDAKRWVHETRPAHHTMPGGLER